MRNIFKKNKDENTAAEAAETKKIVTRYDRKMERRRKEEARQVKYDKAWNVCKVVVIALIVCGLVYSALTPVIKRQKAVTETYITVGDYEFTEQELDFFTYTYYYNWLDVYESYVSYFGLDTSTDLAKQSYSSDMTWKDYFEEAAADTLVQYVALTEAAEEAGFEYDTDEDYEEFVSQIEEAAEESGVTLKAYYKSIFGKYADVDVIEEQYRFSAYASAYYNDVICEEISVTDAEITEVYEETPAAYDYVDCMAFMVYAEYDEDADDDAIAEAMETAKATADEFVSRVTAGEDFNELCIEYSTDDETKEAYENGDAYNEGLRYSTLTSEYSEWLFDDSRQEGDVETFEDDSYYCYVIMQFVDRYYDESIDDEIYEDIYNEKLDEIMDELSADYSYVFS